MEVNGCLELELLGSVYQEIQTSAACGMHPRCMIVFLAMVYGLLNRKRTGVGLLRLSS